MAQPSAHNPASKPLTVNHFTNQKRYFIFAGMDSEIINRINTLLVDEFEVEAGQIAPDADLKTTLDLDSLDYIDLIAITEANFGVKVKPEDFNDIHTFGDFYKYISDHARKELI